ncbi:glutamine cyclotransferase [Rhodopirellula rubra]|uniref:Glutamine cyclotransferase n=1 Tax=Aporhodopirellula rubra TaxID=980271 RepID=A0A7W5H958_9BACT|nr:SdrD B-like domain-containing protein [Aporhodopirellula rubra]MBB3210084.1 glutamine cyclotransferase [Aporhodopirellula rubra]
MISRRFKFGSAGSLVRTRRRALEKLVAARSRRPLVESLESRHLLAGDFPTVESLLADPAYGVGNEQVSYSLTFSEAVSRVDATDFVVDQIGVTGASVAEVVPGSDGSSYTVVVNTGSDDGTLQLRLVDDDTITSLTGGLLGDSGAGNGNFDGNVVSIEREPLRTVNGYVFDDVNNDGVRDAGEPGATGAWVYVDLNNDGVWSYPEPYDTYSAADFSSTTDVDESGWFEMDDVPLGEHVLRVRDRTDFVSSAFSSAPITVSFLTESVSVDVPAVANESVIEGVLFEDLNQNGVRDAGEPGLSGQTVFLDSSANGNLDLWEESFLTLEDDPATSDVDETGQYRFESLFFTSHRVRSVLDLAWLYTTSDPQEVDIDSASDVETANIGWTRNLTQITGVVFDDLDADGIQSTGESGVAGWTVFLDEDGDGRLDTSESSTTTDSNGNYSFDTLPLGQHVVATEFVSGYLNTTPTRRSVQLSGSTDSPVADFGVRQNDTAIEGTLFEDVNENGIFDVGESPISGATVYVDANDNSRLDAGEASDVSGADGSYRLIDLIPGEQKLRFISPIGFEQTGESNVGDRLFVWHSFSSLREVNPANGSVIAQAVVSLFPTHAVLATSLAFDGEFLYTLDRNDALVVVIDPDTLAAVDSFSVPINTGSYWHGAAVVDGDLFFSNDSFDEIIRIDLDTRELIASFHIPSLNPNASVTNLQYSLGETADGSALLAGTPGDAKLVIDPQTGLITGEIYPLPDGVRHDGLAGGNDSFYAGSYLEAAVQKYQSDGTEIGTVSVGVGVMGLATGVVVDFGRTVSVSLDEQLTGIDFGAVDVSSSVTGVQFDDANQNGVQDPGEAGIAGATVFVDLNNNASLDGDEPFAVSASDGTYTLESVPAGNVTIRSIAPENYRIIDAAPAAEKLFALGRAGSADSDTGFVHEIMELDPATGQILRAMPTGVPVNSAALTLEFDGTHLFITDSSLDLVHELSTDGILIDSSPLGELTEDGAGYTNEVDFGLVNVQGTLFSVRPSNYGGLSLYSFDPVSNEFTYRTALTMDNGLESSPDGSSVFPPTITFASAASFDGTKILLAAEDDRILEIDPVTGVATFDPVSFQDNPLTRGLTTLGDEIFESFGNRVEVRDSAEQWVREVFVPKFVFGLASGSVADNGVSVFVVEGSEVADVNHGFTSTLSTLAGVITDDVNANGVADAGEQPLSGATVYLDANRNGIFDAGEVSTVTDAQGAYSFEVAAGDYVVRQVTSADLVSQAWTSNTIRLFAYIYDYELATASIHEIDSDSGEVLNSFAAPGISHPNLGAGLALDGDTLYMSQLEKVFELNANTGHVTHTASFNGNFDGMAIIDGEGFLLDSDRNTIVAYDLIRREVTRTLPFYSYNLFGALGESADGTKLIARSSNQLLTIDPLTGTVLSSEYTPSIFGAAGAGGELFVNGPLVSTNQTATHVRDSLGQTIRVFEWALPFAARAYGADSVTAVEHRVRVLGGQEIADLNFGQVSATGTISGVQFVDENGDGIQNPGEQPLAGVTVFVDANANGWLDEDEPSAVSDVDGQYTIENVPGRSVLVQSVAPEKYRSTTVAQGRDRLFLLRTTTDSESPTGDYFAIAEVDRSTGETIGHHVTELPSGGGNSLGFDGERLVLVSNQYRMVYELATDGTLLDQTPFPEGVAAFAGPAVFNDDFYMLQFGGSATGEFLVRFDTSSNEFVDAKAITHFVNGQVNSFVQVQPYEVGLSESPDGESLLLIPGNSRAAKLDPLTARVTSVHYANSIDRATFGSTSVGGEVFVDSNSGSNYIRVMDAQFNVTRQIYLPHGDGLAGGTSYDRRVVVDVAAGLAVSGINHGYQSEHVELSGTVGLDDNGDGVIDETDTPRAGVTVYLDANRNHVLDTGEITTTTDASGTYSFEDVNPGEHIVRVVDGPGVGSVAVAEDQTRLFALQFGAGTSAIRELDPISGQVLTEFAAPGEVQTGVAGLALGDDTLYYVAGQNLWMLDPDTGASKNQVELSPGAYDGAAYVNGDLFVSDHTSDLILRVDPVSGAVVDTLNINAINANSYNLLGNLSESIDGTALYLWADGFGLTIDPDTGVVTSTMNAQGPRPNGLAAAGGEIYRGTSDGIYVDTIWNGQDYTVRSLPAGYRPFAIAAATVQANEHRVTAFAGQDVSGLDLISELTADFGDASDSFGTLLASDGARHAVDPTVRLGASVMATSDANVSGNDFDDDGITFHGNMVAGAEFAFDVDASTSGSLGVWIDFNGNGQFDSATEQTQFNGLAAGVTTLMVEVPVDAVLDLVQARFRFSTDAAAVESPTGWAPDGEVEDYQLPIAAPTASLSLDQTLLNEPAGQISATVTLDQILVADKTYSIALAPSGLGILDRVSAPQSVVIPAGRVSATFVLTGIDNNVIDGDLSGSVSIYDQPTAPVDSAVFIVADDDVFGLQIMLDANSISEQDSTTATVSLDSILTESITIDLSSSDVGEAIVSPSSITIPAGGQSATVTVSGVADNLVDHDESVVITASPVGYADVSTAIVVSNSDSSTLSIALDEVSISENGGTASGTISLSIPLVDDLVVSLSSSDLGEASVPASVTIIAGDTTGTFTVTGVDELIDDEDELVTIFAGSVLNSDSVDITVTNDDNAVLSLSVDESTIGENGGTANAIVSLSTPYYTDLTIDLSSSDAGEASVPDSVKILAGETSASFTVSAVDDGVDTLVDSSVVITATSAAVGAQSQTIEIVDDDVAVLTVEVADDVISEDGSTQLFARLSVPRDVITTVQLTSDDAGEAIIGAVSINIPAGSMFANAGVSGVADNLIDGDQAVTLTGTNAEFGSATDSLIVSDADSATLSLAIDVASMSENGGAASGTVSLSTPSATDTVVSIASSDTTEATVPVSVTILAGESSASFVINAVDDSIIDETQTVMISGSSAFGTAAASIDVTNDDVNQDPTGLPLVVGVAQEGQTLLTDTSGISDADGLGVFAYQWLRDSVIVPGVNGDSYVLTQEDVGSQISVSVSYVDGRGTAEGPLTSDSTGAVASASRWFDLAFEDFESGFGTYTDGGGDASIHTGSGSHQGSRSANLQDNSGSRSSITLTDPLALATRELDQLKVEFWFYTNSFENGEDFWLQYSDDGSSWQTIASWRRGTDFNNNEFVFASVEVSDQDVIFTDDARIRLRADASNNGDDVYIDEIAIQGFGANHAPVATNDGVVANQQTPVVISVLDNDSDLDGDTISVTAISQAANGEVSDNGDGTLSYTSDAGFVGTDSFAYTISDGFGGTATATVTVEVVEEAVWTDLAFEDFENGFGAYTDGGRDAYLYTGGGRAHQGNNALGLQDNSGTQSSATLTDSLDLQTPDYTELKVEFWYYAASFESNESFLLQFFDGNRWRTIESWTRGVEFQNNEFRQASVTISSQDYAFASNAKIRLMADASNNRDDVYIDEIRISAR